MAETEPTTVAVVDPVPTFRLGLETALAAADFNVVIPADVRAWSRTMARAVIAVVLRSPLEERMLQDLHRDRPARPLVAVLTAIHVAAFRDAIVMGADAAVAWDGDTEDIVGVVAAAARHRSLLPTDIVRSFALNSVSQPSFSDHERTWLDQLAHGTRVTQLARQAGYSEREMHRLLQRLYNRLGAESRSEALVKAAHLGLLTP